MRRPWRPRRKDGPRRSTEMRVGGILRRTMDVRAARARAKHALPGSEGGEYVTTDESLLHTRYLTVFNRTVRLPCGPDGTDTKAFHFDVVGHPKNNFHFCVVFPYHKPKKETDKPTVTVLREYCQGPNAFMYTLPTGGFDPNHHQTLEQCARSELSEEAQLKGGDMVALIEEDHPGIVEGKWSLNRFTPFLVIDAEIDEQPRNKDAEEIIEVHKVCLEDLHNIMVSGQLQLPSLATCYLAFERLKSMGLASFNFS